MRILLFLAVLTINCTGFAKEITVSAEIPDLYVVKSGVSANDRILLEGIRKVKDNTKIVYDYEEPQKVLANLRVYAE